MFKGRRENSLATRLLAYFAENPDEELGIDDICVKFNAPKRSVQSRLDELKNEGAPIEVVRVVRAKREAA